MTGIFVDTSAFLAVLDSSDHNHSTALQRLQYLVANHIPMMTSNYVVVETCALLQRRIGLSALRVFREEVLPAVDVKWVSERQHEIGLVSLVRSDRRKLSLVDCVSFEMMRDSDLRSAFAFDKHFSGEGFECEIPAAQSH
jgi:predicted nucleic acid-binding protein